MVDDYVRGPMKGYRYNTAIVEVNAGTGENYIEETGETIHGSSGHALELKTKNPNARHLRLILAEEDPNCYSHLRNVIIRMRPGFPVAESEDFSTRNSTGIYLLNQSPKQSMDFLEQAQFANALFFFDPLLYTPWTDIDGIARRRISRYYQTGTEFIVFLFTSDWFRGRKDTLTPLPNSLEDRKWQSKEAETVRKMDDLFGSQEWRAKLLQPRWVVERQAELASLYRKRLHKWFRYVLPLPFEPKPDQTYHLFMCSNYEAGVRITRDFYTKYTRNQRYTPDNRASYSKFTQLHPELSGNRGSERPDDWKILWKVLKDHEEGICDEECVDLIVMQQNPILRRKSMIWLKSKDYL